MGVGSLLYPAFRFGGRVSIEWQSVQSRCTRFHSSNFSNQWAVRPSRTRPLALICARQPSLTQLYSRVGSSVTKG